jgi:hypothetical protein
MNANKRGSFTVKSKFQWIVVFVVVCASAFGNTNSMVLNSTTDDPFEALGFVESTSVEPASLATLNEKAEQGDATAQYNLAACRS